MEDTALIMALQTFFVHVQKTVMVNDVKIVQPVSQIYKILTRVKNIISNKKRTILYY